MLRERERQRETERRRESARERERERYLNLGSPPKTGREADPTAFGRARPWGQPPARGAMRVGERERERDIVGARRVRGGRPPCPKKERKKERKKE